MLRSILRPFQITDGKLMVIITKAHRPTNFYKWSVCSYGKLNYTKKKPKPQNLDIQPFTGNSEIFITNEKKNKIHSINQITWTFLATTMQCMAHNTVDLFFVSISATNSVVNTEIVVKYKIVIDGDLQFLYKIVLR